MLPGKEYGKVCPVKRQIVSLVFLSSSSIGGNVVVYLDRIRTCLSDFYFFSTFS